VNPGAIKKKSAYHVHKPGPKARQDNQEARNPSQIDSQLSTNKKFQDDASPKIKKKKLRQNARGEGRVFEGGGEGLHKGEHGFSPKIKPKETRTRRRGLTSTFASGGKLAEKDRQGGKGTAVRRIKNVMSRGSGKRGTLAESKKVKAVPSRSQS